jgi:hypothetical protein
MATLDFVTPDPFKEFHNTSKWSNDLWKKESELMDELQWKDVVEMVLRDLQWKKLFKTS